MRYLIRCPGPIKLTPRARLPEDLMTAPSELQRYEIRKYPNRRFYDVTRSRHVTLDDLYELVKIGHEIVVTDSKTGTDITNVVLTQIILEHDPPKLDLFPASLLHQAIQANQQMVRRFVDEYFAQAVNAFAESRNRFDEFLRRSGFSALQPMAPFDWVRMLFPGMTGGTPSAPQTAPPPAPPPAHQHALNSPSTGVAERADTPSLRDEVEALRAELAAMRKSAKPRKSTGKPRK